MSLALMLLVAAAALAHASWNALIKSGNDKLLDSVMVSVFAGLYAAFALPFLPPPAPESQAFIAASVAIHALYFCMVALAYRAGDMSFAYPLMRGSAPLMTAAAGTVLLSEPISRGGWLGLALLCAGILTLAGDAWRSGRFPGAQTALAFGNALVIVAYTLADGQGVRLAGNAASYICWMFFLNAFPLLGIATVRRGRALPALIAARWKASAAGGACVIFSYGIVLWAMTQAPIALVAALRETSVIFGAIIAALVLHEKFGPARYLAAALVCAGAAALKFA